MPRREGGPRRLLTTVLFTDIVGSTRLATELGDRRWREILARHHAVVRRHLKRARGREIDTAGDGFFAIFGQPADAIECALAASAELRRLGFDIRAGVHMGEVEMQGDRVSGITVHVGARVMSVAGPGEVLVSGTVRELMAGSDIRFEDRGMHELKGVSAQQHLFSVRSTVEVDEEPAPTHPALLVEPEAPSKDRLSRPKMLVGGIALAVVSALVAILVPAAFRNGSPANASTPAGMALMDAKTWKQKAFIPLSRVKTPAEAIYADGHFWVLNLDPISFVEIDPRSGRILRTIAAPYDDVGYFGVDGDTLWVSSYTSPEVAKISVSRARVVATYPTKRDPGDESGNTGVAIGAGSVWVAHQDGGPVFRLDPRTGEVQHEYGEFSYPNPISFGDGAVWIGGGDGIARLDPETGRMTKTSLPFGLYASYVAAGGGSGWTQDETRGVVYQVDTRGNIGATISTGEGARALSFSDGTLWVGNQDAGTVTSIDAVTGRKHTYRFDHPLQSVAAGGGAVLVQLNPGRTYEDRIDALQGDVARFLIGPYQLESIDTAVLQGPLAYQLEYATCAPLLSYGDSSETPPRLVPEVATALPGVSADGRTYTFRVRDGFAFSPPSNDPVTAETFRFSIERALSPEMGQDAPGAQFIDDIEGEQAFRDGKADHISGLEATGDQLTIMLKKPSGSFLARLAMPFFCPVPTDTPVVPGGLAVKAAGAAGTQRSPAAGPYYMADVFSGEYLILKRNPNYGGTRPSELDAIAFREGVDPGKAIQRVQDGSWDGITYLYTPELSPYGALATANEGKDGVRYVATPLSALDYLALNTSRPLFRSAKTRKAVALAVDRTDLAQPFDELAASALLPPNLVGEDSPYPTRESDIARARKLMGPGRHEGVLAVRADCDSCAQFADSVKSSLGAIGIDLTVREVEDPAAEATKPGSDVDIYNGFVIQDVADAPVFLLSALTDGMPASWLPPGVQQRVEGLDLLAAGRREAATEKLAESLAKDEVPIVSFAVGQASTLLSPRLGCTVFPPYGFGLDLAALCLGGPA